DALTFGWETKASTVALTMIGRKDRLAPYLSTNAGFAFLRSAATVVISTSWTWVSCAVMCSDSTILEAVISRMRLTLAVVPISSCLAGSTDLVDQLARSPAGAAEPDSAPP